jgi:hypothetical protein
MNKEHAIAYIMAIIIDGEVMIRDKKLASTRV